MSITFSKLLKNFIVDADVVSFKESIKDYLDVAVFVHLTGTPFESFLDELCESVLEHFTLLSTVAKNLVHVDLLEILGPDSLSALDNCTSNKVSGIGVVNEDGDRSCVILARDNHDLAGNSLKLEWWLSIGVLFSLLSGELGLLSILDCLLFLVEGLFRFSGAVTVGCLVVLHANVAFLVPEAVISRVLGVVPILNVVWLCVLLLWHLK